MDEITRKYKLRKDASRDGCSRFRNEAEEAMRYYHNDQWDKDDMAKLAEEDRVPVVFNTSTKIIHAVTGSEITNRFSVKYTAQTNFGDEDAMPFAEMVTAASRWVRGKCHAEHHDSHAFRDAATCGLGVTETYADMTQGLNPIIRVRRVSPFEMSWDAASQEPNLMDARWIFRDRNMGFDEFKARWGAEKFSEVTAAVLDAGAEKAKQSPHDQTAANNYRSGSNYFDNITETLSVCEYQWIEYKHKWAVYDEEAGDFQTFDSAAQADQYIDSIMQLIEDAQQQAVLDSQVPPDASLGEPPAPQIPSEPSPPIEYKERTVYRSYFSNDVMLNKSPEKLPGDQFSYSFITGFLEQTPERTIPFGLHRFMKDPQMFQNKMLSQLIHAVAKNPKGTILHEGEFFTDPQEASANWSKPSAAIEVEDGALTEKRYEIITGQYPSSMERVASLSMDSLSRVVGVSEAYFLNGADDLKRTPGNAIAQARQGSMIVLSILFDNLRLYRNVSGRLLLHYMRFIPENTMMRVTLPPEYREQVVPLRHSWLDKIEYDIIIDEAPTSAGGNQEFFGSLMQTGFGELLLNMGLMDGPMLAEIIPDAPAEFRARLRQKAAMAGQAPQPGAPGQQPQPTNGEPVQ